MQSRFTFARIIGLFACVLGGYYLAPTPARGDTIEIIIGPNNSTKAGGINVTWIQGGTPNGSGGISGGTPGSAPGPSNPAGTSPSTAANSYASYFNSTQSAFGTATVAPGPFPGTTSIKIAPAAGKPNFTKGKSDSPFGGSTRLLRTTPGRASLDFEQGTGGIAGSVQWTLEVFDQSSNLLTSSSVAAAGNSTNSSAILSAFSTNLSTAGFPNSVGADGLIMDTSTADFFRISVSDAASLNPVVGMTALPEPGTALLAMAGVGLLSGRRRNLRPAP